MESHEWVGEATKTGKGPVERALEYTHPSLISEQLCKCSLLGNLTFRGPVPLKPLPAAPQSSPRSMPHF